MASSHEEQKGKQKKSLAAKNAKKTL